MNVQIKSAAEAPAPPRHAKPRRRYPWDKLEVGGSFVIKVEDHEDVKDVVAQVRNAGHAWTRNAKNKDRGLAVIVEGRKEEREVEAWLVERGTGNGVHGTNDAENLGTSLPEDLPHRDILIEHGYETVESLPEDLTEIQGIGSPRAKEIYEALEGVVNA